MNPLQFLVGSLILLACVLVSGLFTAVYVTVRACWRIWQAVRSPFLDREWKPIAWALLAVLLLHAGLFVWWSLLPTK